VESNPVCLILGDNIFFGQGLVNILQRAAALNDGAIIFAYPVRDPERYGVVEFDADGDVISLEEKPRHPRSGYAVPGIYFYDSQVISLAAQLKPSSRGELEITDLNLIYLRQGKLRAEILSRGVAWLDAGTHESLLQAANFVQAVQDRQGLMISSPEEIAYRMGFIDAQQLRRLGQSINNSYGDYLIHLSDEKVARI
jgi:glucose-1-phosphate thymidylyltransferase